ncbi:WD40/YVTN/BNR-like repeat-containing protein, partial [Pseudomonas guariconensis]|uniref:WD40/YVTN/BNR-like repeat-containing protein n=1 Tax=Pseudomonas guariconensis TaxID=1288410 RepID=UPI0039E911AA
MSWSTPTNTTQHLRDVDYGLNNVWIAIGISGRVVRSTDDGETFTAQTPITGTPHLTAIATDRNGVWVLVGESGNVHRSTDNGATWVKLTLPGVTTEKMNGIGCDKNGVWLIAGDSKVYRSTDNGATWAALTGLPQVGPYLAIGTDDANTFMLSRDSNSANVMRSVDRGATFVMAGSVSVYRTIAYAYDKLKDIWYAAAKEDGIFQSRNAGVTWQKTNVNKATGANISSIAYDVAVVEGAVLRVGNDVSTSAASVFLSNNDGFDYSAVTTPIAFSIRAIASKPDGTAIMV